MRTIDHHDRSLTLLGQGPFGVGDASWIKVGATTPSTQDDETMFVAGGTSDGGQALFGDAHEMMFAGGGADGVDGHRQTSIRAVLEADGEGQTRGQFAMELGFRRSGPDGAEGDEIRQELGRDGIQHLAGDGQATIGELTEQSSGDT